MKEYKVGDLIKIDRCSAESSRTCHTCYNKFRTLPRIVKVLNRFMTIPSGSLGKHYHLTITGKEGGSPCIIDESVVIGLYTTPKQDRIERMLK